MNSLTITEDDQKWWIWKESYFSFVLGRCIFDSAEWLKRRTVNAEHRNKISRFLLCIWWILSITHVAAWRRYICLSINFIDSIVSIYCSNHFPIIDLHFKTLEYSKKKKEKNRTSHRRNSIIFNLARYILWMIIHFSPNRRERSFQILKFPFLFDDLIQFDISDIINIIGNFQFTFFSIFFLSVIKSFLWEITPMPIQFR